MERSQIWGEPMQGRERILITVRTYPTPSTGNRETVCTGGITDQGEWRRLYPVPLRYLPKSQQFTTWDIVEVGVGPPRTDARPESRRPNLPTLRRVGELKKWAPRCSWVLPTVFSSLQQLIDAGRSLGPVTIREVLELQVKEVDPNWDAKRRAKLEVQMLFDQALSLEKIPYEFRIVWLDGDGTQHTSLVISWEMAQTWRKYRNRYENPIEEIRTKLLGDYFGSDRQASFFMGNHSRFRSTFMVCGWFIPPKVEVADGFLF